MQDVWFILRMGRTDAIQLSCYGCVYFDWDNRYCEWFMKNNMGRSRKIPEDVIIKGCHHRNGVSQEATGMLKYLINKFDGEIMP